ncbi:MAG: PilZ domain-containing protein [Desulfomonilaceae bacterium]
MVAEREISAKEIVNDIVSEIGDNELMDKYRLTFRGLQSVYRQLVESKVIESDFLKGRIVPEPGAEKTMITRSPRKEIYVPLPVEDTTNPDVRGTVVNIGERGLGVKGLRAEIGQIRKLTIRPDEFFRLRSFTLKAKCRWVKPADDGREMSAGFEIVGIAQENLQELRILIETLEYMYRDK